MRKAGGETAKEGCNRASDARCAGVPNLGRIGVDVEDFLPQLCGRASRRSKRLAQQRPRVPNESTGFAIPCDLLLTDHLGCTQDAICSTLAASAAPAPPCCPHLRADRKPGLRTNRRAPRRERLAYGPSTRIAKAHSQHVAVGCRVE